MTRDEAERIYDRTDGSVGDSAMAVANEVLRRIAKRERRVEGFLRMHNNCRYQPENGMAFFDGERAAERAQQKSGCCSVPPKHATLIIGEPYKPKPKRTDAQKIEAALKVAADDHSNAAQKMARILRGEEEA